MGKISKTFKKVVLSAIAFVGLTGVFIGTSFAAFKNSPAEAVVDNESAIYDFSYSNNEVKILFNANPRVYKNLNRTVLAELRSDLVGVVKDAINDDIQLSSGQNGPSPLPMRNPRRAYGQNTGIDTSLLEKLINTQLTDQESVRNYLEQSSSGGAYDVLTQVYVERFAESYAASSGHDVDDIKNDIKEIVAEVAQAKVDEIYAGASEIPDIKSNIESSIEATQEPGYEVNISISDVSSVLTIIETAVNADDSISVGDIMDQFSYTNDQGEKVVTIKDDIVNTLVDASQDNYVDGVVELLTNVDSEIVGTVINKVGFTNDDMVSVISNIGTSNLIDIANQIGVDGIRNILDNIEDLNTDELINVVTSDISISDLLAILNTVEIGGNLIYDTNNGGLNGRGVVNLLKTLPKPNQIRNWANENDARLSYDVEIETTLGVVEFKLTIGFFGNISFIRDVAGIIDDAIDVSYVDGELNIVVRAPQLLSTLVERICLSDAFSDDFKHWAYDLLFSTVEDAYDELHNKSLGEYIDLLKEVDYEKAAANALSADFLNDLFNTDKFTDNRINALIDGFMKLVKYGSNLEYDTFKNFVSKFIKDFDQNDGRIESLFNKFKNLLERIDARNIDSQVIRKFMDPNDDSYTNANVYAMIDNLVNHEDLFNSAQNLLARLYNAFPERYKESKIMDFYVNDNGARSLQFRDDVAVSANIERLINALVPSYGDRIIGALSSVLDSLPGSITLDFTAELEDVYKVTYIIGDEEKVGLLPVGADIGFFANTEELEGYPISKWVYANGDEAVEMVAEDIEVYAIYDFEVDEIADVEKAYKEADSVEATITPTDVPNELSYQWYKEDGTPVANATESVLDLTEFKVADSGKYYVVVSEASFDGTGIMASAQSDLFEVKINKAEVEEPAANPNSYVYNAGNDINVVIPANDLYTLGGDLAKKDVGSYNATAALVDKDNYQWKAAGNSNDITIPWSITPFLVDKPAQGENAFVYNGQEQTYQVAASEYYVVSNNKQTNAGSYNATIALANANYAWADETTANLSYPFSISPALVAKPTAQTSSFVYTGNDITFAFEENPGYTVFGNVSKNVGNYLAVVNLSSSNYKWADGTSDELPFPWTITPFEVAKPATGTNSFTYNGQEITYAIAASDYYTVSGNVQVDAGDYIAIIRLNDRNYVWADTSGSSAALEYAWEIKPISINKPVSGAIELTYNGSEQTADFGLGENLVVIGNKGTNAGEYTAVIMIVNGNYVWSDGTDDVIAVTWKINKQVINVPAIIWNYTSPFTYDGQEHEVTLVTQFDPAKIRYEISGTQSATEAGEYVVTLILSPLDEANFELNNYGGSLTWKIEGSSVVYIKDFQSIEKDSSGTPITTLNIGGDDQGLRSDYTLHSPALTEDDKDWNEYLDAFDDCLSKDDKNGGWIIHNVYDIHFKDENGQVYTASGQFTVRLLIPEEIRDNENLIIIHIADDKTVTEIESRKEGNYMVFNTTHFSLYAIAEKAPSAELPVWPFIIIIALLVVIIILQVLILLKKAGSKAAPAQEEKPEEKPEEPVQEEAPAPEVEEEPEPEPEPEEEPEEEEAEEEEEEEFEEVEEPGEDGQPVLKKKRKKMVHFQTKLSRSEKELRHKYYDLRDYIKSYGINNRISIPCDTFSLHRKRYVVITIAGKRLKIYLAADPAKYEGTPIPIEATRLKKYEDLPTMFKVKSDLSVKRAKAMIDDIMVAEGYERKE